MSSGKKDKKPQRRKLTTGRSHCVRMPSFALPIVWGGGGEGGSAIDYSKAVRLASLKKSKKKKAREARGAWLTLLWQEGQP
jgi:hypothetical protein